MRHAQWRLKSHVVEGWHSLGWGLEMRDYPRHYTVINDSVSRWVELGDILKRWNSAHKPHFSIRAVSQSGSETFLLAYPPSIDHQAKPACRKKKKRFHLSYIKKRKSNDHQSLYSTIWEYNTEHGKVRNVSAYHLFHLLLQEMEFNSAITPLVKTDPVRKRDLRSAMFNVSQNTSFQTQLFSVH